jgi:hypothetical protein
MTIMSGIEEDHQVLETMDDSSTMGITVGMLEEEARKRKERLQQLRGMASKLEEADVGSVGQLPT